MTEQPTTADNACAFTEAWTSHDMETASTFVAAGATFDSPAFHLIGKQAYLDALDAFARTVTDATILASFGDESQALIMYEATVGARILTCIEQLTFRDGKIVAHVGTAGELKVRRTASETPSPSPIT